MDTSVIDTVMLMQLVADAKITNYVTGKLDFFTPMFTPDR